MRILKITIISLITLVLHGCSSNNSTASRDFEILNLSEFNLVSITKYEYEDGISETLLEINEEQFESLYEMLVDLNTTFDKNDFIDGSNIDGPNRDYSAKLEKNDVIAYIGFDMSGDPENSMVLLTYDYNDGTRDYYITDSLNNKFYDLTELYDFLSIL